MAYLTPDEAEEQGVEFVPRPGEPADLTDPFHYQTPDESKALGRDFATQQAIRSGNARHAGFTPDMSPDVINQLAGIESPTFGKMPVPGDVRMRSANGDSGNTAQDDLEALIQQLLSGARG